MKNEKSFVPRHPFRYKMAGFFGSIIVWLIVHILFFSCRKSVFGNSLYEKLRKENNGKVLVAGWHRSMFYTLYFFRNCNSALMSSRSRDGELITAVVRRFGYFPPRGSTGKGKGGGEALLEFISHVNKGYAGGLAVDAPTGPPYISKHGIIKAASETGAPILGHMWYADPIVRFNSWDRTMLPKLFSRLVMVIDREPLYVPADVSRDQIEECRQELDRRMLRLTYQTDNWFKFCDEYSDPRDIPVPDPIPAPYHPPKKVKKE